jgi:hypothetical protein
VLKSLLFITDKVIRGIEFSIINGKVTRMSRYYIRILFLPVPLLVHGCGGGGNNDSDTPHTSAELPVMATPGDDGVFDPAPVWDGASALWMGHSSVNWSSDDPKFSQVHTRIAMSRTAVLTGLTPVSIPIVPFYCPIFKSPSEPVYIRPHGASRSHDFFILVSLLTLAPICGSVFPFLMHVAWNLMHRHVMAELQALTGCPIWWKKPPGGCWKKP